MSGSDKSYKIVQLQTENVKRLKAVNITPEGNIVEITGENGNGKSSVLDSIFWNLAGQKEIQSQPIRNGEAKAKTEITLSGGLSIRRTFNRQDDGSFTTALVVETEEGARFQKPQDILNKMVGELSFDPLEFTKKKPAEQFDILKEFVSGFDFEAEARDRKRAFDARTDVNRRIRELKSQSAGISYPDDTPDEEIDVSALTDELQEVGAFNADIETRKGNRQKVSDDADRWEIEAKQLDDRATELRRQADELDEQAKEKRLSAEKNKTRLLDAGPLPDPKDPSVVRAKIDEANATNSAVQLKKRLDSLIVQVDGLEEEANSLSTAIDESDVRKSDAIAKAEMPVPGIGFGDGCVTLNGVPFDQASSAEQLRAAVGLTMAANPRLRVILIRDGSLLGTEAMRILSEMAVTHDFQVWIETVESDRPGAIIIEDGMVKSASALEAAE
jgi:DNA repair exonuclease SbcCD ATPase subunit